MYPAHAHEKLNVYGWVGVLSPVFPELNQIFPEGYLWEGSHTPFGGVNVRPDFFFQLLKLCPGEGLRLVVCFWLFFNALILIFN